MDSQLPKGPTRMGQALNEVSVQLDSIQMSDRAQQSSCYSAASRAYLHQFFPWAGRNGGYDVIDDALILEIVLAKPFAGVGHVRG